MVCAAKPVAIKFSDTNGVCREDITRQAKITYEDQGAEHPVGERRGNRRQLL